MKKCKHCEKEFKPKNPKGKFCSDKCRVYFSRKKSVSIDYTPPVIYTSKKNMEKIKEVFEAAGKIITPKTLDQLKAMCPHPPNSDERRIWVSAERQKYGI